MTTDGLSTHFGFGLMARAPFDFGLTAYAQGERAECVRNRLRAALPARPWPVVRQATRQCRVAVVFGEVTAAIHDGTLRASESPARLRWDAAAIHGGT